MIVRFSDNYTSLLAMLLLAAGLFLQCAPSRSAERATDADLGTLVAWMIGDFSSEAQSLRDSDFLDIRLHIRPIWLADRANYWLYVEQATAAAEDKPYRQRIYKVEREGRKGFVSIVYTLPEPAKWAGAYKNPSSFDQLEPSDLTLREGCAVFLEKQKNGAFVGATRGEGCESNIRGAKYASSKVTITKDMLLSWDQGFDAQGQQVWGATKGGYEFLKK
ncbi:MAG: chromophore lyase CpcT/CpeT [Saprospiraceae bacterium]|nr:chromophore lyase CpcT/CpeT [Saprospiraceae bacterium]